MATSSTNFLLNLAVLKVNWDDSRDFLHNFMPLVGYAVKQLNSDVVSVDEIKLKIEQVAQFRIPSGALEVLIRRASKPRYGYVIREGYLYKRALEKLSILHFERDRAYAAENFNKLLNSFRTFCRDEFGINDAKEATAGFFEVLFEVAPHVIQSAAEYATDISQMEGAEGSPARYRVARFVVHSLSNDTEDVPIIDSFFQGAILAESFYYTSAEAVRQRFREMRAYYDTTLLSHILGYSTASETEGALELHQMLLAARAKVSIFDHTLEELSGIFDAASTARRSGPLRARRPSDIFDWLNRQGYSSSDIELERARIPEKLAKLSIDVRQTPTYTEELGINEFTIKDYIRREIEYVSDQALGRDIDSLSAIFRIRGGRPQQFLESCKAIFVTTNSNLARASTAFFNAEHGISDAPICITNNILCMLVWLKTVDKQCGLPKELIVANCVAALNPSRALWERYMSEADRLRYRGDISETDYALLAHSLEARQALMDETAGDTEAFLTGGVIDVLGAAKDAITQAARVELEGQKEITNAHKRELIAIRLQWNERRDNLERFVLSSFSIVTFGVIVYLMITIDDGASYRYIVDGKILKNFISIQSIIPIVWILLIILSSVHLVLGLSLKSPLKSISSWIAIRFFPEI